MTDHKHFYIFDMDGTLAKIDHRSHLVRNGNRQWKEFFEACDKDEPNWPVIETLLELIENGVEVEIWSGRSDSVREKTEKWLDQHIDIYNLRGDNITGSSLLKRMRPANDYQSDVTLKESWLKEEKANNNHVIAVFDDRQKVVDMWRENGVACFQVAPGDFDEDLKTGKILDRKPTLTMMVGPSGAGKSHYIEEEFSPSSVVSTDAIREEIWGNRNAPEAFTQENFSKPHQIAHRLVRERLSIGLDTVHDATNIKPKDRKTLLKFLEGIDFDLEYYVIDRPLEDKLRTMDQQNPDIVRKHHETFQQNVKYALSGDNGLARVFDLRI